MMEQWASEWAREMKKGKRVKPSPIIGIVTKITPLELSIYNGEVMLYSNYLYITNTIQMYIQANTLDINDKVMIIPAGAGQKYFVIDKVV